MNDEQERPTQKMLTFLVLVWCVRSTCGVAALSCLFGIGLGFLTENSSEEKLESVESIAATLRKYVSEAGADKTSASDSACLSSVPEHTIQEVGA